MSSINERRVGVIKREKSGIGIRRWPKIKSAFAFKEEVKKKNKMKRIKSAHAQDLDDSDCN